MTTSVGIRGAAAETTAGAMNRSTYRAPGAVATYGKSACWLDRAERILLHKIADEVRGRAVLDVGVGAGRTAWLLQLLTSRYTAIDYSPEMVAACRSEFPEADIREGDARELSNFATGTFKLVLFSFNGLDALSHEDRLRAITEFSRVLEPGGLLLYSTTNKAGPYYGRRPWQFRQLRGGVSQMRSNRGSPTLRRFAEPVPRFWRCYRNWRRSEPFTEDGPGWAMGTHHSHEYGLLVHYSLPSTEREVLASLDFQVEALLDTGGEALADDSTPTPWFHVLARKAWVGQRPTQGHPTPDAEPS
jgi:ubiquinone/menaquinone biosynthesis C-methylase UbiE